jgi:hypothetical protein
MVELVHFTRNWNDEMTEQWNAGLWEKDIWNIGKICPDRTAKKS